MASIATNQQRFINSNSQSQAQSTTATTSNSTSDRRPESQNPATSQTTSSTTFTIPTPTEPQRRRRSRNVNEQDRRIVYAIRTGTEVRLLGAKSTTYVDCVRLLRDGSDPPPGYHKPDQWKPGAEIEHIAKVKKLSQGLPPWDRERKSKYPSQDQLG